MFIEEIRRAVQAAPKNDLTRLSALLWKAYAGGAIGEGEAQGLSELIEAKKAAPASPNGASARRCGSRPRSSESLERRRRWCASGRLPPQLAAKFTIAEAAALAVVAVEVVKHGDCRLCVGTIAAIAGICERSVRNGLRAAERLGLLSIEARRLSAFRNQSNIVKIISAEWKLWLSRGSQSCKKVQRPDTRDIYSAPARPSAALKRPSDELTARFVPRGRR
jgi:hypothetical protein